MKQFFLYGCVVAVLSVTGSCSGPSDPAKVHALDSMLVHVDSLLLRLNAVDTVLVDHMDSVFRAQRPAIEAMLSDTLTKDTALIIGNYYRAMNKSVGRVRKDRTRVLAEVRKSAVQLKDLRHDISRGILPEGPENTYFDQEVLVLSEMDRSTQTIERSFATAQREWMHHAAVDSILAERSYIR